MQTPNFLNYSPSQVLYKFSKVIHQQLKKLLYMESEKIFCIENWEIERSTQPVWELSFKLVIFLQQLDFLSLIISVSDCPVNPSFPEQIFQLASIDLREALKRQQETLEEN